MTNEDKIKRDMTLGDVVKNYPDVVHVMMEKGLHCIGCHATAWETIEQGAKAHGMSDKEIDDMVNEMNNSIKNKGMKTKNK